MELFNETYRDPDIANWIFGLLNDLNENFLILNNDTNRKLQHIYDLFTKQNLSKNEVIFKIISETPELFIKINDAITLDYMSKCGLIKIDDFDIEDDKYPNFIELFGFETNVESMNTYKMFMEKSISFIRAINRSICFIKLQQKIISKKITIYLVTLTVIKKCFITIFFYFQQSQIISCIKSSKILFIMQQPWVFAHSKPEQDFKCWSLR